MRSTPEPPLEIPASESFPPQMRANGDRPRRRSDVSVRLIEGETVVFDRRAGLIHQLNQTATYIWERCDGTCTVPGLARQLSEDFDVDPAMAEKDVVAIIAQLQKLNLLQADEE
jgi:PqqD family protein of HPr-rel-A system